MLKYLVLIVVFIIFSKWDNKRRAKKIIKQNERIYSENQVHEFVDPKDFPFLDLEFYDDTQKNFERLGFRHIADIENVTISKEFPSFRTFNRCMLSEDGAVTLGIFHVRIRGWMRILQVIRIIKPDIMYHVTELETELSDGRFVVTANGKETNSMTSPPEIITQNLTYRITKEELLKTHMDAIHEIQERDPNVTTLKFSTYEELEESGNRMRKIRHEFKKARGYITKEEIEKVASSIPIPTGKGLAKEIEKLNKERNEEG